MEINKNIQDGVLANVEAMLGAPGNGVGPDVVVVVSSSDEGASFWQERLTGSDGVHGSGAVVKPSAIVCSVSESNWKGPAGNALGTINAFYLAAIKAGDVGLLNFASDSPEAVLEEFLGFCQGKSVSMYHTAGKGTRLSPLTASEHNSKSRIKLPGMIEIDGNSQPITVLESAIRASSIYASSRQKRLSVFWGDQVLLNELDVKFDGKHHVEIFAQPVRLDESIRSYGILIPRNDGDCLLREKLDVSSVRAMFPELSDTVYRSVGSFSISFEFFRLLAASERHALVSREGALNTDNDWWQALTSTLEEYTAIALGKGIDVSLAEKRWVKTREVWEEMVSSGKKNSEPSLMIGLKDTGMDSLWMDFGRNSCLFENIKRLTGSGSYSICSRMFFALEIKNYNVAAEEESINIENSVVVGSRLKKGNLKNSVVVSSDIEEVYAENSVIIGSDIRKLNSEGALCYNVVSLEEKLIPGDILVNVFHPEKGRIQMGTNISRDGQADWISGERVGDNEFSYPELAKLVVKVPEEDIRETRRKEELKLKERKRNE